MKLADVLWEAANEVLSEDTAGIWEYSCDAVVHAIRRRFDLHVDFDWGTYERSRVKAKTFLAELGCPTHSNNCFGIFKDRSRQGVRYMWLLLAMHVAEDEGIEV